MQWIRIVLACSMCWAAQAFAQDAPPPPVAAPAPDTAPAEQLPGVLLDRIVAVVNDGVVLESELDERVKQIDANMRARNVPPLPRDQIEDQVLERLIIAEAQHQRAVRLGIEVDDDTLNRMLTTIAQRNGISFDELPQALAQQGIDYQQYREMSRREMQVEQLRSRDVYSRINITQNEIDAYMRKMSGRDDSTEYRLSHILISSRPVRPTSRSKRRASAQPSCVRGRPRARISRASPWRTPRAHRPCRAATSAGASSRPCRLSSSTPSSA